MTDEELSAWHSAAFDRASLLRAHTHVTTTRMATEGNSLHRRFTASTLRSTLVVSHQRTGATTEYARAEELPGLLEQVASTYAALPSHPFLRAAWIVQAVGAVHPFVDQNGGTCRLLSSIELTRERLPPFVLTGLQRNTGYVEAIIAADADLTLLLHVVHNVVQQQLANVLANTPPVTGWTEHSRELAATWTAHADAAWRSAASIEVERDLGSLDSFLRRGYHIPLRPEPHVVRWSSDHPIPIQFHLAITPVLAGDAVWTIGSVVATVGEDGTLAPIHDNEPIAAVFVAAPTEPQAIASARFSHWLAKRIEQSVRGLAAWM